MQNSVRMRAKLQKKAYIERENLRRGWSTSRGFINARGPFPAQIRAVWLPHLGLSHHPRGQAQPSQARASPSPRIPPSPRGFGKKQL